MSPILSSCPEERILILIFLLTGHEYVCQYLAFTVAVFFWKAWLIISRLPIIGTAIIYSFPPNPSNKVGLLLAFYCTQFYVAEGNLVFSLLSRNIAGQTKKSTTLTITFVAWAAGNMTAPQVSLALPHPNPNP